MAAVQTVIITPGKSSAESDRTALLKALDFYYKGDIQATRKQLESIKIQGIREPDLCLEIGWLHYVTNSPIGARQWWQLGLDLQPDHVDLRMALAELNHLQQARQD